MHGTQQVMTTERGTTINIPTMTLSGVNGRCLITPHDPALIYPGRGITPIVHLIVGFEGTDCEPDRDDMLAIAIWGKSKSMKLEMDFLVLDVPTAYNAIIEQSTFHNVKAVLAQVHYESDDGSTEKLFGDRPTARECYLTRSQSEAGEEKNRKRKLERKGVALVVAITHGGVNSSVARIGHIFVDKLIIIKQALLWVLTSMLYPMMILEIASLGLEDFPKEGSLLFYTLKVPLALDKLDLLLDSRLHLDQLCFKGFQIGFLGFHLGGASPALDKEEVILLIMYFRLPLDCKYKSLLVTEAILTSFPSFTQRLLSSMRLGKG
ncbi:hypothetical protein Cgig2_020997 [Carnegiea gigantea]|uniref:Uncharacterized protein n=1 Tax=Carnegiea gigantea TaxID=171969 RepID=A0A9Q1QFG4_9CARY|nr:hypothetical protein Cgig2_020997 [Carnegiea gigantea]